MLRPFHIIIVGIFALLAIGGLIAFSLFRARGSEGGAPVVVWGTVLEASFRAAAEAAFGNDASKRVSYVEKRIASFDDELVLALADGIGPDLILVPHEIILLHRDRLFPLSVEAYPERLFRDTFVEGGEILISGGEILGLPLAVDPLVMYWNRDLFTAAGVAAPPKYWDEALLLVPSFLERDAAGNIVRTALALGEYRNITNAKDILSALFLQSGVPIVVRGADGKIGSALSATAGAVSAVGFYTDFANPVKVAYAWNRSLPPSEFMFRSGSLGMYFGLASELPLLRVRNPNLNFDVALLPQPRGAKVPVTSGRVFALAALKSSRNLGNAVQAILSLSAPGPASAFVSAGSFAPARRDLIGVRAPSAAADVFYRSALLSRGWFDVNPEKTEEIFAGLIDEVTTGRETLGRAIENTGRLLEAVVR